MTTRATSADLVHASHVRLAYRAMLGREASPEEVRVQLAGLRTTGELLQILSASEEFTGTANVLLDPGTAPARANMWHPDFAEWTHQPGTISGDGVAIVGTEGWLFIHGGSNSNLEQYTGQVQLDDTWGEKWSTLMAFRTAEAARLGISLASIVVPDKLAVQTEFFPEPITPMGPRPIERLIREFGLPLIYPIDELRAARADGAVYLRNDSHYSLRGNFVVYQTLARTLGISPLSDDVIASASGYLAPGDLGSRFDPPILEVMYSTTSFGGASVVEDNRGQVAATGGHIGSRRVFRNPDAPDRRVAILFGDSYGFADKGYEGLVWFMAQAFQEVHFVWTPFGWDGGYAERAGAEVVVCQTAERFISRVPAKSIDVDQLVAKATNQGKAINPDIVFDERT